MGQARLRKAEIAALKANGPLRRPTKALKMDEAETLVLSMTLSRYHQLLSSGHESLNTIIKVPPERWTAEALSPFKCPDDLSEGFVFLEAGTGEPLNCVQNVWARMKADPTLTYQLGMTVWTHPTLRYRLEAHCVIKHPDGRLEDVTSYCGGDKRIAFFPVDRANLM